LGHVYAKTKPRQAGGVTFETTPDVMKRAEREQNARRPPAVDDELQLVLLADDDYDNREMYAGYLRANGFRVAAARDGAQAIRLARQLRPAIIILDVQMPRVDGIAATRTIRRDEKLRDTPILVVTACDPEEHDAINAGANAVCVKPCMPADLIIVIQRLLRHAAKSVHVQNDVGVTSQA
jgi:two-component system cell cycle response regulator DivK